jgi:hypothetical protein
MTGPEPALAVARDTIAVLREVAAMLEAAAEWADDERAGGKPDAWLLRQLITADRLIAAAARGEQPSRETAAWLTVTS